MKIQSLLNNDSVDHRLEPSARAPASKNERESPEYIPKKSSGKKSKTKLVKDAPKYVEGEPPVMVVFPPHAPNNDKVVEGHEKLKLHPPAQDIFRYPRYIPYKCDKRPLSKTTGLEGLHLFHYTFDNGHPKGPLLVAWDYHHGLVKITAFFKALRLLKTAPRKAIDENKGLGDVCFNITGGDIVAQGYWWPYAAARAIAATFCYDIRYALTPVFGNDFPDECLRRNNDRFQKFAIDPRIVRESIEATLTIKRANGQDRESDGMQDDESDISDEVQVPGRKVLSKSLRPRQARRVLAEDDECEADTDEEDRPLNERKAWGSKWTAMNRRSVERSTPVSMASVSPMLSSVRSTASTDDRPTSADTSLDTRIGHGSYLGSKSWKKLAAKRKLDVYQYDSGYENEKETREDEIDDDVEGTLSIGRPKKRHTFALREEASELMSGFEDERSDSKKPVRKVHLGHESPKHYNAIWPQLETILKLHRPDLDAREECAELVKLVAEKEYDPSDVMEAALSLLEFSRVHVSNREARRSGGKSSGRTNNEQVREHEPMEED